MTELGNEQITNEEPEKRGRPARPLDLATIKKLAGMRCTYSEMAAWFDMSERQFHRRVKTDKALREAIALGVERGKATLRHLQFKLVERGSAAMAIWLGRQLLGQTGDTPDPDAGRGGFTADIRARMIERLTALSQQRGEDAGDQAQSVH